MRGGRRRTQQYVRRTEQCVDSNEQSRGVSCDVSCVTKCHEVSQSATKWSTKDTIIRITKDTIVMIEDEIL